MLSAQLADIRCFRQTYLQQLLLQPVTVTNSTETLRYRDNILAVTLLDTFGLDGSICIRLQPGQTCPFCGYTSENTDLDHTCTERSITTRLCKWNQQVLQLPLQLETEGLTVPPMGRTFHVANNAIMYFRIDRAVKNATTRLTNPRERCLHDRDLPRRRMYGRQLATTMTHLYRHFSSSHACLWYGLIALFFGLGQYREWSLVKLCVCVVRACSSLCCIPLSRAQRTFFMSFFCYLSSKCFETFYNLYNFLCNTPEQKRNRECDQEKEEKNTTQTLFHECAHANFCLFRKPVSYEVLLWVW